jgi:hypothetical protein
MTIPENISLIQCGRHLNQQEVEQIQETVNLFPKLSRKELAQTICENLEWFTASGRDMSKLSHRPGREEIKAQKKKKKKAEKELRKEQKAQGLEEPSGFSVPNRKSGFKTVEEEIGARNEAVTEEVRIFKTSLPVLLKRLSKISDPRNPKKTKHKLTVLMLYGIIAFVYHMASRREANRKMTNPIIMKNLKLLFPELESMPHNDTLERLLARIDVNEIEKAQIELVRSLIRKKKFVRYLIEGRYPIAIDGTQKIVRDYLWSEECLERNIKVKKDEEPRKQYYVYVLEASLAFQNGMTIPLMSEFLNYAEGDTATKKQDCELKAFKRLAQRLKAEFRRLPIIVLLDGLYPNGPVMTICRKNRWDFMIVLQNDSLSTVWEEYDGLLKLLPENNYKMNCGKRKQHFQWVNDIVHHYDRHKRETIHVVVCNETWEEVDKKTGEVITKRSHHAWISSKALDRRSLHERCNLGARHRWNIETGILIEKHHGYNYEHCFSYDWNSMKGYHYLMRIGHGLKVLSQYSESLIKIVKEKGIQGFVDFVRETIMASLLDIRFVKKRLSGPIQLRLI